MAMIINFLLDLWAVHQPELQPSQSSVICSYWTECIYHWLSKIVHGPRQTQARYRNDRLTASFASTLLFPPPPPFLLDWEIKRASAHVCVCVCVCVCVPRCLCVRVRVWRCDWWISTFSVCLFKRPGALSRWGAINNLLILLLYRPS